LRDPDLRQDLTRRVCASIEWLVRCRRTPEVVPMRFHGMSLSVIGLAILLVTAPAKAQLGSRPAEEWIKTLDGPTRAAGRLDEGRGARAGRRGQAVSGQVLSRVREELSRDDG
jgi:hypothetical protein